LNRGEAHAVLRELMQAALDGDRKHLATLAAADEGPGLRPRTATHSLLARVVASVEQRRIVFLRGWSALISDDDETAPTTEPGPEELLVARALPKLEEIPLEGRRYLLIPARRWRDYRGGGQFEIVRAVEAQGVCQRLAGRIVNDEDRREAWLEAGTWLADGRRLASEGEGLVLIRRVLMTAAPQPTASTAATTPSQAKKQADEKELTWIEIVVRDDEGHPYRGQLSVKLPDGRTITTIPDEDGSARFDQVSPGNCELKFVELDSDDVAAA
jgi:hypothetical protein